MYGHNRGHVLGKNGKKDRWGLCVSMSLELTLGVHVINACVLREHGHVTSRLKQDHFRGERSSWQEGRRNIKNKPELHQGH